MRLGRFAKVGIGLAALILVAVIATSIYLLTHLYSESVVTSVPCTAFGSDKTLSSLASVLFKKHKISGGYLISKNGNILAQAFCGTSEPSTQTPITSNTKFNIGSLTKQFTGYLVLELKRENKLKMDDTLSKYIPEIADRPMGKVTIGQLVQMRAGIPYILPLKDFVGLQASSRIRTQKEMIQQITALDLLFEPGERFEYNNLGYSLIAIVVSRIDQRPWAESLKHRIFGPFKMIHSTSEGEVSERPQHLAVGLLPIEFFGKKWFLALPHWNYSMIKGAGGIVSTVEDLHQWNEGLTQRQKLDPTWGEEYFPSGTPSEDNYSFGWFRSQNDLGNGTKVETINHGGEDPGYCATNIRLAGIDAHIALTTNSDYCALKEGAYRSFTKAVLNYIVSGPSAGFEVTPPSSQ